MTQRREHPVLAGSLSSCAELVFGYPFEFVKVRGIKERCHSRCGFLWRPCPDPVAAFHLCFAIDDVEKRSTNIHWLKRPCHLHLLQVWAAWVLSRPPSVPAVLPSSGSRAVFCVRDSQLQPVIRVARAVQSVRVQPQHQLQRFVELGLFVLPHRLNTFIAGMCAGLVEAATCIVPMTTMQVKFCHDQSLEHPRFQGFVHGVKLIVKEHGFGGLYQVRLVQLEGS